MPKKHRIGHDRKCIDCGMVIRQIELDQDYDCDQAVVHYVGGPFDGKDMVILYPPGGVIPVPTSAYNEDMIITSPEVRAKRTKIKVHHYKLRFDKQGNYTGFADYAGMGEL